VPDLPDSILTLIFKAMAKDPPNRYQTMKELAEALEAVCGGKEMVVKAALPPALPSGSRSRGTARKGHHGFDPRWLLLLLLLIIPLGWWLVKQLTSVSGTDTIGPLPVSTLKIITNPTQPNLTFPTIAWATPAKPDVLSHVLFIDDFNDSSFAGSTDSSVWEGDLNQAYQQSGFLKIETKKNQICNTVISASKYIDHNVLMIKLTQPVYFQADLMIDNQYWGDKNNPENISLQADSFVNNMDLIKFNCSLRAIDGSKIQAHCYDAPPVEGEPYHEFKAPVESVYPINEWHTFRIELYPQTKKVIFKFDGQTIGDFTPHDAEKIFGGYWQFLVGNDSCSQQPAVGYVDNVEIGLLIDTVSKSPTATPLANCPFSMPGADSNGVMFEDNFDNHFYDGSINRIWTGEILTAQQADGILSLTQQNKPLWGYGIFPIVFSNTSITEPIYFEADVMIDPNIHSAHTSAQIYLQYFNDYAGKGTFWSADCTMTVEDGGDLHGSCSAGWHKVSTEDYRITASMGELSFGTWHHLRIELYPATMNIKTYMDGFLLGDFYSPGFEQLKTRCFQMDIGTFTKTNSGIKAYFDNVRIGRLTK